MKKGAKGIVFRQNPIYKKEVSTGTHAARLAVLLVGFNTILAIVAFIIFYNTINGVKSMGALDYSDLANLYTIMAYIEFCIVALVVPAITAGSVVGERERQTLDVMLASRVYPSTIIWGKLFACMQLVVAISISSLPILSIVFVYGGIKLTNLLILLLAVICSGFFIGSIGILASCVCKRMTSSVVLSYTGMIVVIVVTCGIVYIVSELGSGMSADDGAFLGGIAKLMLINPASTIVNLVGEQLETVNYFEEMLFGKIVAGNEKLIENWTLYSIVTQVSVGTLILIISSWILNPLKYNLWRRIKKSYEKRRRKNETVAN